MSITSKYIVLKNTSEVFLDFDLRFEDLNFYEQHILISGSTQIDGIGTLPGTKFDFSNSKASSDIIKLSGSFADYISHFSIDESGVILLDKGSGSDLEALSFVSANTASDALIFNDYTTNAKAIRDAFHTGNSTEKIYINSTLSGIFSTSSIDSNGNLDLFSDNQSNIIWLKVKPISNKTLVFIDGSLSALALSQAVSSEILPTLDVTETSINKKTTEFFTTLTETSPIENEPALVKAIAFDQTGENFTGFGTNVTLNVSGNSGVDKVYVKPGSQVDATNLKGSKDEIYFTGKWDEYSKDIDSSGNITFSRMVNIDGKDSLEFVSVSNGSVIATNDMLIFADGALTTKEAYSSLKISTDVLSKDISEFDSTILTPQLAPVLNTALSKLGNDTLDVRSDIVFKIDQPVKAVEGKTIRLIDNTAVGYQGENNNNSFTISVTSPAVKIDNDNGLIIVDIDTLFDLDLSSSYTLSVDNGAFQSINSGISTEEFTDIKFNTVTPISGSENLVSIGSTTNNQNTMSMDINTGNLIESSTWVDIEGLGNGTLSGTLSSLDEDVIASNVFKFDAATGKYIFVFSDKDSDGFSISSGSAITTATDFSVYLQNLGTDDRIYIDDAHNDPNQVNIIGFDFFTFGNGSIDSPLFWGGSHLIGDPRIYVDLEGELVSQGDDGNSNSSLLGVNKVLGLDINNSLVTSDSAPILVNIIEKISLSHNGTNTAKQGDTITLVANLSEKFELILNNNIPKLSLDFSGVPVTASYVSHDPQTKSITFSAIAPVGNTNHITLTSIDFSDSQLIGSDSGLKLSEEIVDLKYTQFILDNTAPSAPTIADVTADNVINGAEQTTSLSGTAEANASVSLSLGGLTKALTADADGAWSYTLTADDVTAMSEGDESITITVTDAAGNTSTTTTKAISVDTVAPTAPTIADVTVDNVINGAEQTTSLSGTAEANASVSLSLGGLTKALTADADGAWSYTLTADDVTAMGEGDESITITATDAAGNTSAATTKAISVDTVAPTAPTIADVTADNVINGAEQIPSLSGTAEANASVSLSLGGLTKAVTADADGAWSYTLTADDVTAMGEGDESITITATDAAGNTSTTTTKAISVDTVAPTAPTIADVTVDNVINGAEQTTSLSGTAEANASVSVSLGGLTKAVTADAQGAWSYSLTEDDVTAMGEGDESITITATDAAGNTSTTTTKAISVDTVAPTAPTIADVTADNVINGAEQTTSLSGTAEANASVSLSLGGLTKALTADADGAWSYTLTADDVTAMGEGDESITITATDAAGNTSTTTTKAISVDTVAARLSTSALDATENGTAVGVIKTSEVVTVTLADTNDSDLFSINEGVLTLNTAQDFESDATSLTVDFDLVDTAGNTSTDSITVNITDVNEAPIATYLPTQSAMYNQYFSLDISSSFSDVDIDDTLTYSVVGNLPKGLILTNHLLSGVPNIYGDNLPITIRATDSAGLFIDNSFVIDISGVPQLTTELADLGSNMLDVRSLIILKVNQPVNAVEGKSIVFIDNTATGYQGETNKNNFTIDVTSDLVTIDNEKGLIIINVDENFDLDLSSEYTMSVDDGAFKSTVSGLASGNFSDITFETVTPTNGAANISKLGQIDEIASQKNFFENKWLVDWLADTTENSWYDTSSGPTPTPVTLTNAEAYSLLSGGTSLLTSDFKQFSLDYLRGVSDDFHHNAEDSVIEAYDVLIEAAQGYLMSAIDGSLEESAQWVDIEGLGIGTTSGTVASLSNDIASGNVVKIDASSADYVFVFSDQNPNGGSESIGSGLSTNTDFSVFLDNFGNDDLIFVDDAFNDSEALNILSYEFFASGSGGSNSELFVGLINENGDPRLYIGLADNIESIDENDFADSSINGVAIALGHDAPDEFIITA